MRRAELWPEQVEAVEAAVAELAAGGRAQVVMACGTGKTRIAADVSGRLAAGGLVLITVPSLDLITQTARALREWLGEGAGQLVAVCSDRGAMAAAGHIHAEFARLRAQVTTDPAAVAAAVFAAGAGRVSVLCTYESVPVVAAAHRDHGLRPWDLVVVDEAHRTAGAAGKAWALVHDDRAVPAARRLYLTATPRIALAEDREGVVSMDDPAVYGPEVYRLPFAQAIASGRLADYRVLVSVVTDTEVAALVASAEVVASHGGRSVPPQMLAAQIALARAVRDYDLRRVITYHARVHLAKRFAGTFDDAITLLAPGERPRLAIDARSMDSAMRPADRRRVLAGLVDPDGAAVVSNCRVLTEGVDVPALDAVMFADPRDSTTDVVQAVGRALRRGQDTAKVATIILPVLVSGTDSTNPTNPACAGAGWDTVWRVARALRAHDERLAHWLDAHRIRLAQPTNTEAPFTTAPPWLRVTGLPVDGRFAQAITLRMVEMTTSPWLDTYAELEAYSDTYGDANVPSGHRTDHGTNLGSWLRHQRLLHRRGLLPPEHVQLLEKLNVDWEPYETRWWNNLERAKQYHAENGNLNVPVVYECADGHKLGGWLMTQRQQWAKHQTRQHEPEDATSDRGLNAKRIAALNELGMIWDIAEARWQTWLSRLDEFRTTYGHANVTSGYITPTDDRLGSWLSCQRVRYRHGKMPPEQVADLEHRGVKWNRWEQDWQEGLAHLTAFHTEHGHSRVTQNYITPDGYDLGVWIRDQRRRFRMERVTPTQKTALDKLDMVWHPRQT